MAPGGPPVAEEEWRALVRQWFPDRVDTRLRRRTWSAIAAHQEVIASLVGVVPVSVIHQRLRDEAGLDVSVASVRRYVLAHFEETVRREQVTVLRPTPPPGQEAQVDYGYLGVWFDPVAGRRRRVWAFSMVCSHSRHLFVRPVLVMDQAAWVEAHVKAFEFFKACPRRLVPDNLRAGVARPDLYDPKINRAYGELAAHYLLTELLSTKTQVEGHIWDPPFGGEGLIDRRLHDRRARGFERHGCCRGAPGRSTCRHRGSVGAVPDRR
jgi:hypothetical protein